MGSSSRYGRCAVLVALSAGLAAAPAALARGDAPNIAVIILDDVGVELLDPYTYWRASEVTGVTPPEHRVTPSIDTLARRGLLFRNAWSTPLCRPTRAALLTGTYGFHNGVIVHDPNSYADPRLPTLPERLRDETAAGYPARGAVGKWHLSPYTPEGDLVESPTVFGFTSFAGSPVQAPYTGYEWVIDPPPPGPFERHPPEYRTTKEVAEAIAFVEQPHAGPWLLWFAPHAAHSPWDEAETPVDWTSRCSSIDDEPRRVRCRQLEIVDEGIGDLLAVLRARDPGLAHTTVILLGDNGSPDPSLPRRPERIPGQRNRGAKGSLYEGGVNVPLIVAGAGVSPNDPNTIQETDALVHVVDVFATLLDLAGVSAHEARSDGVSFADVLAGAPGPRSCVYTDGAVWRGGEPREAAANHDVAIRTARHKLIRRGKMFGVHDYEFYDLLADPGETTPLAESGDVFQALRAELERIDRTPWASPCNPNAWVCGLGPELAPALLLLAALRRRRRRRRGG